LIKRMVQSESDAAGIGTHRKRGFGKRLPRWSLAFGVLLITIWIFRITILQGMGSFLIKTDASCTADALYVLGGASFDRGAYSSRLLKDGGVPVAYCTGENVPQSYKAEGRLVTEAELSRAAAIRAGADPAKVLPFPYGTSTWEEASGVLHHAKDKGFDTVLVLTTDLHTRRVGKVFCQRFAGSGITVLVHAAPSSQYDAAHWWTSEEGLLMVNNEYVKSLYYAITY